MTFLTYCLFLMAITTFCKGERSLERKDIVNKINRNPSNKWKAQLNFNPSVKLSYKKTLLGVTRKAHIPYEHNLIESIPGIKGGRYDKEDKHVKVPVEFDARVQKDYPLYVGKEVEWTTQNNDRQVCQKLISRVDDQGHCGSSWAIAAASVFSDRRCIFPNEGREEEMTQYSAKDILGCFTHNDYARSCDGGDPGLVFEKYSLAPAGRGLTTEICRKYNFTSCRHSSRAVPPFDRNCLKPHKTQKCYPNCEDGSTIKYEKAQHFVSIKGGTKQMQKEIYYYGPLVATFEVYEDFLSYKSGVYHHVEGKYLGDHAVKVIGWGQEDDTDYWLAINSWGKEWGDKGTFKIKRGEAECHFDNSMIGVDFIE